MTKTTVKALDIRLHEVRIGILTHYSTGATAFIYSPEYAANDYRDTATVTQFMVTDYLQTPQIRRERITPLLANLLPEGAMREYQTRILKTHSNNDFALLASLGADLAGGITAVPIDGDVPSWAITEPHDLAEITIEQVQGATKFSLAGVQLKFSSHLTDGRYNITGGTGGQWIIKTPSTIHKNVPENEFSTMTLAKLVGIEVPDIKLIPLSDLDNLPDISLPDEQLVYAIKRFDRTKSSGKIHTEDFAQITGLYPGQKYDKLNYEMIGRILKDQSQYGLADIQQMARRLLVNILLANGDAHAKNWSLIYPDRKTPKLSPAYDIVSTMPYIRADTKSALNLGKNKEWYQTNFSHFELWSKRIGIRWSAIKPHLEDVREIARNEWPTQLEAMPMATKHKEILRDHWAQLTPEFRI